MAYKDLGIEVGMTMHAYTPEEELTIGTVVGEWRATEAIRVFCQDSLEWIEIDAPCPVMGVRAEGPIMKFGDNDPIPILLEKMGTRYIEHYQTIRETEKAIIVSLDGSDHCTASVPKSVIRGKTRQRKLRDPEAMKTPIADWWARKNERTMGPIR